MKKNVFTLIITFCVLKNVFALTLGADDLKNTKCAVSSAAFFTIPGFESFISLKTPKKTFDEFSFFEPTVAVNFDFQKYANFPLYAKFGNLSPSGSISKLNNPHLSKSLSSFTKFSALAQPFSANYKRSSNKENVFSSFLGTNFPSFSKNNIKINASLFADEKNTVISAFQLYIPAAKRHNFSLFFTQTAVQTRFSNQNQSWFSFTDYFPCGYFYSLSNQIAFSSRFLRSKNVFNLYQSRTSFPDWTFSSENTFSLHNFTLSSALYFASSPFIFTPAGKNIKTMQEFFINPYFTYFYKNLFRLRLGTNLFYEKFFDSKWNITEKLKISGAVELKTRFTLFKIDTSLKNVILSSFNTVSLMQKSGFSINESEFSMDLSFSYIKKPALKASVTYTSNLPQNEEEKFLFKLKPSFQIALNRILFVPVNAAASITIKNEGENVIFSNLTLALSTNISIKNLIFQFYTNFTIP